MKTSAAQNGEEKGAVETVAAAEIKTTRLTFCLIGTSPLLVCRPNENAFEEPDEPDNEASLPNEPKKGKRKRKFKDPAKEYEDAKYLVRSGKAIIDCFPSWNIRRAVVQAAEITWRQRKGNFGRATVEAGVFPTGDLCPIKYQSVRPHKSIVTSQDGRKTKRPCVRAQYDGWSIPWEVDLVNGIISSKQVADLLRTAGFSVGIGKYRGPYGRFRV